MSGSYTVQFNNVAVTDAQDLFELVGHASKPYVILGFHLAQTSEVGDAQEEGLTILLKSGQTTSGSGGTSPTPVNNEPASSVAAGFTAEANNTVKASAGTIVTHHSWGWNVRGPLDVLFTEQQQLIMAAGRRCTLELLAGPGDSITMSGTIHVQEIG